MQAIGKGQSAFHEFAASPDDHGMMHPAAAGATSSYPAATLLDGRTAAAAGQDGLNCDRYAFCMQGMKLSGWDIFRWVTGCTPLNQAFKRQGAMQPSNLGKKLCRSLCDGLMHANYPLLVRPGSRQ